MNHSKDLTQRFILAQATAPADFLLKFAPVIKDWLLELAAEQLPPKDDCLRWIADSLRQVLESTEFPFADEWLDVAIRESIVAVAGRLYDWVKAGGGTIV